MTNIQGLVSKDRVLMTILARYFTELTQKYPDGKMQAEDFKKIFHLAFPERKADKVTFSVFHLISLDLLSNISGGSIGREAEECGED